MNRGRAAKADARLALSRVRGGVVRAATRADDCLQQHAQLLAVERLLQQRNMRVPFFEGVAVSGHEREGDFLFEQNVGNVVAVLRSSMPMFTSAPSKFSLEFSLSADGNPCATLVTL